MPTTPTTTGSETVTMSAFVDVLRVAYQERCAVYAVRVFIGWC